MSLQIIPSLDGSHTLFSEALGVTYHSHHGAIQESSVVFIDSGLNYLLEQGAKNIKIFELGFGTGLNCLLTYIYSKSHGIKISYTGVDTLPIPYDIAMRLNYGNLLNSKNVYESIINLSWGINHTISSNFTFQKFEIPFQDYDPIGLYNIIYLDAFGPATQPELWDETSVSKFYEILEFSGVLVTYCAQGQFKRNLKKAGFKVDTLPGPPGKREMVRAEKIN